MSDQFAPPPGDNPSYQPPAGQGYPPPSYPPAGYPAPGALALPEGVQLASSGRRIGAWFLAIPLAIVTLGIGYLIWGAIVWGKGTSPALQVLGMKVWKEDQHRPATWGEMALRNIVGGFLLNSLCILVSLASFVMFLSDDRRRTIADRVATTTVVHDPNKRLG